MNNNHERRVVKCRWCENLAIQSHIVPASILRTARAILGDKVGDLRHLQTPNRVVQDIGKLPLLCETCDGSFSDIEDKFRNKIYEPLLVGETTFEYQEWLTKFAIFLAWKRLATGLHLLEPSDAVRRESERAMSLWEDYLRGKTDDPGYYQHHLFFTRLLDQHTISEVASTMLTTVFDTTLIEDENVLWVWTTVPGCMLLSCLAPKDFSPWDESYATRIFLNGKFDGHQTLPSKWLFPWIDRSVRLGQQAADQLTERQWAKIRGQMAGAKSNRFT